MAYLRNNRDDEEEQGQFSNLNGLIGNQNQANMALNKNAGGVLGGSGAGGTGAVDTAAPGQGMGGANGGPTRSGMKFVNIQRYLEQNPQTDISGKIRGKADKIIGDENTSFKTA